MPLFRGRGVLGVVGRAGVTPRPPPPAFVGNSLFKIGISLLEIGISLLRNRDFPLQKSVFLRNFAGRE